MSGSIFLKKTYLVLKRINRIMCYIGGFAVLSLTAATIFEMISRFGFGRPTVWSLDISRYFLLLVGLFSLSFTMQQDGHVYFSILIDTVPSRMRRGMALVAAFFGLIFCGVLSYYSVKLSILAFQKGWGTMAHASIPLFYLYLLMGIGAIMLSLTFLFKTLIDVLGLEVEKDDS